MVCQDREGEREVFGLIEKWLSTECKEDLEMRLSREKERNFVLECRKNELKLKNEALEKEIKTQELNLNQNKKLDVINLIMALYFKYSKIGIKRRQI